LPLVDRAQFLVKHGRADDAKKFLDLALRFEPDMNANTEQLHGRDREAADHIDQEFSRYEAFRKSLGK
jgi:hypothetical protein